MLWAKQRDGRAAAAQWQQEGAGCACRCQVLQDTHSVCHGPTQIGLLLQHEGTRACAKMGHGVRACLHPQKEPQLGFRRPLPHVLPTTVPHLGTEAKGPEQPGQTLPVPHTSDGRSLRSIQPNVSISAWAYLAQPPPLCRLGKKGDSGDLGPEAVTSDPSELSCSETMLLGLAPQLQFWDRSSAADSLLLPQQGHLIRRLVTPLHGWQANIASSMCNHQDCGLQPEDTPSLCSLGG